MLIIIESKPTCTTLTSKIKDFSVRNKQAEISASVFLIGIWLSHYIERVLFISKYAANQSIFLYQEQRITFTITVNKLSRTSSSCIL